MARTQIKGAQVADGGLTDADMATANKDGTAATPSLRTLGTGSTQAAAGDHSHGASAGLPAGIIFPYGGSSAPTGYLLCDGSTVSRTTYAGLFTAIGTNFGAGDGSTTFALPDLRGRAPVGKGTHADVDALNDNDGVAVASRTPKHTHTGPSHTHVQNMGSGFWGNANVGNIGATSNNNSNAFAYGGNGEIDGTAMRTGVQSGGTGATGTSVEPYLVVNYIIKT